MEAVTAQPPSDKPTAGEGIYVYCIVESAEPRSFGKIGIGGRGDEVYTVHHEDLAAVVSRSPLMVYDPTRENALTHEHVNEVVMIDNNFTPVPMSFGTLFKTEDDTREFLKDTYKELRDVLGKMKKAQIETNQQSSTYFARMQLGRLVEQALAEKSEAYVREIYEELAESVIASRSNKVIGDRMIMNGAFLVARDRAGLFDKKVQEIGKHFEGKLSFKYTGPWPPYNFVTIRLKLERAAGSSA